MTEKGVVAAAGFRSMPPVDRWALEGWDALRGLPWHSSEAEALRVIMTFGDDIGGRSLWHSLRASK